MAAVGCIAAVHLLLGKSLMNVSALSLLFCPLLQLAGWTNEHAESERGRVCREGVKGLGQS